jgi:hypothetical protein
MVLVTTVMACVSMTFAVRIALRAPLPVAIVSGAAWGFVVIMNLDRMLVVSMQRQEHWWSYFALALPRFAFALLLGFIISIPFTLQIFAPEISAQVAMIHQQKLNVYLNDQKTGPEGKAITASQKKVAADEATIDTGFQPGTAADQTVPNLSAQIQALQKNAQVAYDNWQCQLYGGAGCPQSGNGPVAQAARKQYQSDESQITELNKEVTQDGRKASSSAATARAEASAQLIVDEAQLKNAQDHQTQEATAFRKLNNANDGLLIRVQALDQVTSGDGIAAAAHWSFFALFAIIECLPVLVKILLSARRNNACDETVKAEEGTLQTESTVNASDRNAELESNSAAWQDLLPQVSSATAAARLAVYQAALGQWVTGHTAASPPQQSQGARPAQPPTPPAAPPPFWTSTPGGAPRQRERGTAARRGLRRRAPQSARPNRSGAAGLPGTFPAGLDEPLIILREPPP